MDYSPWGRKESDTTELSDFNFHLSESEHHQDGELQVTFQKQVLAAAEMLNPKCMRQG